jgi:hypothetical protein
MEQMDLPVLQGWLEEEAEVVVQMPPALGVMVGRVVALVAAEEVVL